MNTKELVELVAKGNHVAADVLHLQISAAGKMAELAGQQSDSFARFQLHQDINNLVQSQNGQNRLVVKVRTQYDRNFVEYSLADTLPGVWLVAVKDNASRIEAPMVDPPCYWEDGMGEHWDVLLIDDAANVIYIDRESMTGRTSYTLRIVRSDQGYYGIPVETPENLRVVKDEEEVLQVWESMPVVEFYPYIQPELFVDVAPIDITVLATKIDECLSVKDCDIVIEVEDEEDEEDEGFPDYSNCDEGDEDLNIPLLVKARWLNFDQANFGTTKRYSD